MKNTILPRILMLWMLLASYTSFAISPSSDCGTNGSQQISVSTNACNTTSFDFSSSIGSPSLSGTCASGGTQDGWGWFNATGTSTTVTASPSGNNDRNIALMIYSGTCGSLTLIACVNSTSQPDPETATFTTVNGANYFIRVVRMSGNSSNAENDVCVTNNVAPTVSGFSPSAGCVGSTITINGTNLSNASSVKIGGTNATILSNSSTVITATVGSGTTGTVSVTTPGGTNTSAGTFTVNQLPTQYNVTGGGSYCPGGAGVAVTLSNSTIGVDYQLKLGAGNVGSPVSGTGAGFSFGNQTGAGSYTVVATNTSTTCGRTMSGNATVSINTNAGISSQPPNRTICENANTNFSVTANGTGPFTYQWQNNSSGSMANIAGATNSTYNVTGANLSMNGWQYRVLVTGACGPVVNSNTVSLTVNAVPVVTTSASPVNAMICGSGSVTLTASGASSYSWSPGGGNTAAISVSPLTSTSYTVTGTTSGCSSTASQNVTVNPAVTALASASLSSLCAGSNTSLAAAGGNSTNYAVTSIPYSAPLGSGSVAVTGDDAISGSVALPFTFNYYGVAYNNIYVCTNGFIQLGSNSGDNQVYGQTLPSNNDPDNIIAGVLSDLNSANNISTFTTGTAPNRVFTIYYNNVQFYCNSCSGSKRGNTNFQIRLYEKSNIVEIHMHDLSNNSTTSGATKTLGLENANGSAAKVPPGRNGNNGDWMVSTPEAWRFVPSGGTITYSWSPSTYLTDPADTNPTAQNMLLSQNYVVTITDQNGCTAASTAAITVNQLPNVAITPSGVTAFCNGNTVTLTASAGLSSYSWNTVPVQTTQSIVVNAAANYTVTGTNASNCSNTASQSIVVYDTLPANIIVIGSTNLCTGQTSSDLQATQTNAVSYVWNTTEPTSLITVTTAGTYSVTATDNHGCHHNQSQAITESTPPVAPVIVPLSSTVLCSDGITTSSVVLHTSNYTSNLTWSTGDATTDITVDYSDYFNVIYTDPNGCFSVSNPILTEVKMTSTDPVAAVTNAANNSICAGVGTTLSVQGGSLGDDAAWMWYEGSCSGTSVGTGSSILVNPSLTTTYFVRAEGPCNTTNCAAVTVVVKTISVDPSTASPSAPILCGSGNSNLTVNGGSLGTGANWVWYEGGCGNGAPVGSGATLNVTPSVTTVYYVRAEGDCNISNCAQATVTVKTLSVDPTLATNTAAYNEICNGSPVQLTVNGGTLGSDADWVWYEGNCASGLPVATGASVSVTPAGGGNHTYYVRAEGYCNNTNCVNGSVFVRTAGPSSTVSTMTAPNTACTGTADALTINNVTNATFYSWSGPAGVLFNGNAGPYQTLSTNVPVTFGSLPGGSSGYSVCVFAGNACGQSNTICKWVRGKVSTPGPISGSTTGCPNASFPYSVAPVAGADTYTWTVVGNDATLNGTAMITVTTPSPSVDVDFAAPFSGASLQVYASLNCGYSSSPRSINISRNPAAPGTMSGVSYVCPSGSASYSVPAVNGAATYNWTCSVPGAVISPSANSASILFPSTVPAGSSVCVTAVTACGYTSVTRCKGIASGLPNTPSNITGPATGQCGATGVSFTIPPVSSATSYTWNVSNGNATIVGPNNLSSVTVDFTGSLNNVQLSVSAGNLCGNSGTRSLTVFGKPGVPASITGNNSVCNGSVEFYSTGGSSGANLLTWTVPPTATILGGQGSSNLLVIWGSNGGQLKVAASNSCGSSANTILPISVTCRQSQLHETLSSEVKIYPNPAHDKMKVEISSFTDDRTSIELINALGEIVYRTEVDVHEGTNLIELNLENLAKGFYNLSVQGSSVNSQHRVVIQ